MSVANQRTTAKQCRSCASTGLAQILDLGRIPLANTLLTKEEFATDNARFPLGVALCEQCTLVQLTETVPPETMFREYSYFSSFSETMLEHAARIAQRLMQERNLGKDCLVVEIASNDGYLLKNYQQSGIATLGIEPAYNVAEVARKQHGIHTISEFFGEDLARRLASEGFSADVMHANNVFAHVPDINGFVEGIATLLKSDGVAVIETPYVKDMIERCEFDTIYHEHVFYYSLTAIDALVRRHGLYLQDVEVLSIHGGTLRVFIGKENKDPSGRVAAMLTEEKTWVGDRNFYLTYSEAVQDRQEKLRRLLKDLKSKGKRIAAYGAAAKGSTLLNTAGIGTELLDFAVDRSPYKQGLYMSGSGLQIFPTEELLCSQPDYVLLLTWNFAEEIIRQQAEYIKRGGQFITSYPYPHVLSGSVS